LLPRVSRSLTLRLFPLFLFTFFICTFLGIDVDVWVLLEHHGVVEDFIDLEHAVVFIQDFVHERCVDLAHIRVEILPSENVHLKVHLFCVYVIAYCSPQVAMPVDVLLSQRPVYLGDDLSLDVGVLVGLVLFQRGLGKNEELDHPTFVFQQSFDQQVFVFE
jgi:hypothetical protein